MRSTCAGVGCALGSPGSSSMTREAVVVERSRYAESPAPDNRAPRRTSHVARPARSRGADRSRTSGPPACLPGVRTSYAPAPSPPVMRPTSGHRRCCSRLRSLHVAMASMEWNLRRCRTTLLGMSERSRNLPRRSCLSVPGSSEKMLAKAPGLGADMVFLDLEDAVAPLEKEGARDKIVKAINEQDWGETVLCVRVNAWDTEWTYRDVIAIVEGAGERLDELMLPKVQSAAEVAGARHAAHADREGRPGASRASASKRRSRPRRASSTSRRSAPRATGSRRSSSAPPTSPPRPRCRCSRAGCRSPSTRATTSTTCSRRSSWPAVPTACR